MKKVFLSLCIFLMVVSSFFASPKIKIFDYKGASEGADLPKWVSYIIEDNQKKLDKYFSQKGTVKYFIIQKKSASSSFVQEWAKNVNGLYIYMDSIISKVEKYLQNTTEFSIDEKICIKNTINGTANIVIINGLEVINTYWLGITEEPENYYVAYVVATMTKENYLDSANQFLTNFAKKLIEVGLDAEKVDALVTGVLELI